MAEPLGSAPSGVPPLAASAEKLLDVAGPLFFRHGFAAVGVDRIVKESGVAKMTLYRHFPSKDDLIAAWLERVDAQFWAVASGWMGGPDREPRAQLAGFFRGLEKLVASPQCLGCPFLLAAAEFPEPGTRAHEVAKRHKTTLRERFRRLARAAGAGDPAAVADQLLLLTDGAFGASRMFGPANAGRRVAAAAETLLDAATR